MPVRRGVVTERSVGFASVPTDSPPFALPTNSPVAFIETWENWSIATVLAPVKIVAAFSSSIPSGVAVAGPGAITPRALSRWISLCALRERDDPSRSNPRISPAWSWSVVRALDPKEPPP